MPKKDYNRYSILRNVNRPPDMMPFVKLPENPSDKYEVWNYGFSRMDKISLKYYGNPFYDFLILMANPQYRSEFDIEDNTTIRIPFPLKKVVADYESIIESIKNQ